MNPLDWVVAGLGNPGLEYAETRHNLGFWAIDRLDAACKGSSWVQLVQLRRRLVRCGPHQVMLVKPMAYMNNSGGAVAPLLLRYQVPSHRLIVIHDDKDLTFGKLRLQMGGGDGGHKGIRSLIDHLGDRDFIRVRLGIGAPPEGLDATAYVLAPMVESARDDYRELANLAAEAIQTVIRQGLPAAMNKFNGLPFKETSERRHSPETL